jgi:hypothetical protein
MGGHPEKNFSFAQVFEMPAHQKIAFAYSQLLQGGGGMWPRKTPP